MREIVNEGITRPERFISATIADRDFFEKEAAYVLKKVGENIEGYTSKFPPAASQQLVYGADGNYGWTPSFWTGMLWLAYELTGDKKYLKVAQGQLESYKERLKTKTGLDHDTGFIYILSSVAAYKLTGNEQAKEIALEAANILAERYLEGAGIIQVRGSFDDPENRGKFIIDCCMNLPLLYWAEIITGNAEYKKKAVSHIQKVVDHIIRDDASTFQGFVLDGDTGAPINGFVGQGLNNDSCWSRGQAWGIYGLTLSYRYTKDWNLIETAKKLANYFLNRLPEDLVCCWDLVLTGNDDLRDSSAAAIAVCGLMELAKYLPLTDPNKLVYENAVISILKSLAEKYTTKAHSESNGILMHGMYSYHRGFGIDECCIWGDYFYLEALVRVLKDWKLYW